MFSKMSSFLTKYQGNTTTKENKHTSRPSTAGEKRQLRNQPNPFFLKKPLQISFRIALHVEIRLPIGDTPRGRCAAKQWRCVVALGSLLLWLLTEKCLKVSETWVFRGYLCLQVMTGCTVKFVPQSDTHMVLYCECGTAYSTTMQPASLLDRNGV